MATSVTMEDLKKIFDDFNQAISADDIDKAIQFRDKSFQEYTKTPAEKAGVLQMMKYMIPISYTTEHLDQNGKNALLYITGVFKTPDQKTATHEARLSFVIEDATWKFDTFTDVIDLANIKHLPDEKFEPKSNFALDRDVWVGGRVVSVKFEPDYTAVTIRVVDEENLIFLPKKADLGKTGIGAEQLVPWKILSIPAHPHKSNTFKLIGDKVEIIEPSYEL